VAVWSTICDSCHAFGSEHWRRSVWAAFFVREGPVAQAHVNAAAAVAVSAIMMGFMIGKTASDVPLAARAARRLSRRP
jgi:hypothetical protein